MSQSPLRAVSHKPLRAVLFDLDGTLLDTVGDLACAANRMLAKLGLARREQAEIRNFVGKGTAKLVERCLDRDNSRLGEALEIFNRFYREESGRSARIYPGVLEGFEMLAGDRVLLGCVTNKPEAFTRPLLQQMGLAKFFATVVSGDTVARRKPDPMPFVHACAQLGIACGEALVVGDSANDMDAGRAAGCRVLCVPYGYREGQPIESLDCDAVVDDVRAAAAFVRRVNRAFSEVAG
ncbi:MAG: phosphoglycolate phosphatase [Betaproteobacteria bacterium RIFCSPLOWO2_02_FULL_62_17]|nr:MAG: phosphoglycolate phosphatase [Betaproteobacteria bacterium RIFCSPLOWO2_02_FULL_62_17]